jgi:glycosyltransferase involved in cell wall biosynthesis
MLQTSVVVPTHNRSGRLITCLESLNAQDAPADSFEVIVVDDGSTDDTLARLERFEPTRYSLRVIGQENAGPASARNRGTRAARGEFVLFIDDDCEADSNWLAELQRSLAEAPETVAGSGGMTRRAQDHLIARYIDRIGVLCPRTHDGQVLYLVTCNAIMRRAALIEVDGFSQAFSVAGGEDPDLCARMSQAGYSFVVASKASLRHHHPRTLRGLYAMYSRYGEGMLVTQALGRRSTEPPEPYRGYVFLRHLKWPNLTPRDAAGFLLCECVKNLALLTQRLRARLRPVQPNRSFGHSK